jgi:hypothetical protein
VIIVGQFKKIPPEKGNLKNQIEYALVTGDIINTWALLSPGENC